MHIGKPSPMAPPLLKLGPSVWLVELCALVTSPSTVGPSATSSATTFFPLCLGETGQRVLLSVQAGGRWPWAACGVSGPAQLVNDFRFLLFKFPNLCTTLKI
jgi:hypothetical protein